MLRCVSMWFFARACEISAILSSRAASFSVSACIDVCGCWRGSAAHQQQNLPSDKDHRNNHNFFNHNFFRRAYSTKNTRLGYEGRDRSPTARLPYHHLPRNRPQSWMSCPGSCTYYLSTPRKVMNHCTLCSHNTQTSRHVCTSLSRMRTKAGAVQEEQLQLEPATYGALGRVCVLHRLPSLLDSWQMRSSQSQSMLRHTRNIHEQLLACAHGSTRRHITKQI